MQVEGPDGRDIEDLLLEHVAVVEGEDGLRCQLANALNPERMVHIFGREDRQVVLGTELGDRVEEAVLARIVGVGKDRLDLIAGLKQGLDTGAADIVIGKDDNVHD